jgi:glycosyltransferase involved in cell wall biosynthesis
MKIMFCITNFSHGRGGHFFSLKTTAQALENSCDISIVNFGFSISKVLQDINIKLFFIRYVGFNFLTSLITFIMKLKRERPDVIHAFDEDALVFARLGSLIFKIPLVYTKCGGPNPAGYFPIVKNQIMYSGENLKFFKEHKFSKNVKFWLIPNRVGEVITDTVGVKKMYNLAAGRLAVLRICRISPYYEVSIRQSVEFISKLKNDGINAVLFVVGAVQDRNFSQIIQNELSSSEVIFVTDDEMTINASKLIEAADCVVGTGRGLMEAASLKKIVLTPAVNSKIPVLVDDTNINSLLFTNFSERNFFPEDKIKVQYEKIVNILKFKTLKEEYKKIILKIYDDYFNIKSVVGNYLDLYAHLNFHWRDSFSLNCLLGIFYSFKNVIVKYIKYRFGA